MASTPHQLRRVALTELGEATLKRFHGLMEGAFPLPELVTYDELVEALADEATVSGTVLLDGDEPVAGTVTERYVGGRVVLLAYLVVAPAARNTGLGSRLLAELATISAPPEGGEPPLVVAEIEDPRYHPSGHRADPVARVRFYDRAGARLLPLDYAQPSLRPGSPRVGNLLLIALGTAARDLDGRLVARFLEEYYAACEGEDALRSDPAFASLRHAATGDERGRLTLHRLADLDAARPGKPRGGRAGEPGLGRGRPAPARTTGEGRAEASSPTGPTCGSRPAGREATDGPVHSPAIQRLCRMVGRCRAAWR